MAFRSKRREKEALKVEGEKILDVDASMQGSLTFRDPVNLRINGKFEGSLNTKGNLTVGENAQIKADIVGEDIVISGKVFGSVVATKSIKLTSTAHLTGDINTPRLSIAEGAVLQGKCQMEPKEVKASPARMPQPLMSVEELAGYLEIDANSILDWAKSGKLPAEKEGNSWRFDRTKVDVWIASEKIK